jgi:murein L,D-transpeptidase YcbB/YkuD
MSGFQKGLKSTEFLYNSGVRCLAAKIQLLQAFCFSTTIIFLLSLPIANAYAIEAQALRNQLDEISAAASNEVSLATLKRFYSARDYQPVWVRSGVTSPELDVALAFIAMAENEGLNSNDYQLERLLQLRKDKPAHVPLELELQTTQALLMLARDLRSGRLSASAADPDWHIPQHIFDPVNFLQESITSGNLQQSLNNLPPKMPDYQLLKQTLANYRGLIARQVTWTKIPDVPSIRPNMQHVAIPLIRARIAQAYATHGKAEYNIIPSYSEKYDIELVNAIKVFQRQHGFDADGIIGKNTQLALNKTPAQKIQQLRINMERLRWLPRDLGDRYVLADIAGFHLTAMENGKQVLDMRIIVGRDYRSTPSFSSCISHMILNPFWNIPNSIARKDLLPKQQKDPSYFTSQGIKVYSHYAYSSEALDPDLIDWRAIKKNFPYTLRQDPGKKNALGTIKFMFPNPFSIYFHDTPSKSLFQKDIRAFSSGCIRLEKPIQLAGFSLNDPNAEADLISKIESGKTMTVNLVKCLPVYLVYLTARVDDQNNIHFSSDTYGRDARALGYARW